ncbi:glutamate dehydrogenase [Streptomyces sp. NPDC056296]|uniref:terpene synthase family protein n=1 Tax=Streptomyces sp. NPDC056296 TaxID=3345775 RepID=UPI0035D76F0B
MTDTSIAAAHPAAFSPAASTKGIQVDLPPVFCPMPLRCHPDVSLLERRGIEWMDRHGFCRTPDQRNRVTGTKTAHFFAYLCPDADAELLQAAVDWGYLMFVFDDRHCDEESDADDAFIFLDLAVRIVRTLEAPDAGVLDPRHPFTAPVTDLAHRIHRTSSPTHVRRLVESHRSWFSGVAWDQAARTRGWPTISDYLFTRMLYVASFTTLTWFQLSEHSEMPDRQINAPAVHALTEMAGTVAAIDDDLYSYGKELWFTRRRDDPEAVFPGNLVNLLRTTHDCTLDQALRETVVMRDRIVDRFIDVRDRLLPHAGAPLQRYLSNLTCLIPGNFAWGLAADRYTNPDGRHPGAVTTRGSITDIPSATGSPGIPSIAWWWHDLPLPPC